MPNLENIRAQADEIIQALRKLAREEGQECIARAETAGYEGLAELEELRSQTENLRQQLHALEKRSKLDPAVIDVERKLDEALSCYYWLWLKCKEHIRGGPH